MAGENEVTNAESTNQENVDAGIAGQNVQGNRRILHRKTNDMEEVNTDAVIAGQNRKRSFVWDHFTEIERKNPNDIRTAACNYCKKIYNCDPKQNGTSTLGNHLKNQCKKYPFRNLDKNQTTLGFKVREGDNRSELVVVSFSAETCRKALAKMMILDELPFKFVDGEGFRNFIFVAQPKWTSIQSRFTIAKDCFNVFVEEKKKLKTAMLGHRVCLTTDTWTSIQNLNFMCLTAHFIDADWKLHKRILNFCIVESHKGEDFGKVIEMCLLEWGIDKILTLAVDNASSNNKVIEFIKSKTKYRRCTILEHEFLHMRCCAHILNLVVRDGLKEMHDSTARVRNTVRYVRSSPQRFKIFKLYAEKEKIKCKSMVCLDVPTRWNYTYMMFERAEKFSKAFERLEEDGHNFLLNVNDCDGCNDGCSSRKMKKVVLGPPTFEDWQQVRLFARFLKVFYDATLRFSGSMHVPSNSFFMELIIIQDVIELEVRNENPGLKSMTQSMKSKFEKYWGNFDIMNPLLYISLVLDPRYKMCYVKFCFENILMYDVERSDYLLKKIKDKLIRLYDSYVVSEAGVNLESQTRTQTMGNEIEENVDPRVVRMSQFKRHLKEVDYFQNQSEVEKYLSESCEDVEEFDILAWWKINSPRFRVISVVARHVLAVPVSTVASESVFSTAGRVLDPFCSALQPKMIEALICSQNWLRSSSTPINLRDAMDYVEEFEKMETEFTKDTSEGTSSNMNITRD